MQAETERRTNPRLRLCYPIEVQVRERGRSGGTKAVTTNLSARGAYFKTFSWEPFERGQQVWVKITVPHPMRAGDEVIHLNLEAGGQIRRMDRIVGREALEEDGLALKGVALEFDSPLSFSSFWG